MFDDLSKLACNPETAWRCSEIESGIKSAQGIVDGYRTIFMSDRDRILYCKSFRRLAGKTQVYTPSQGDDKRTRLTHTLEVSQITRTIALALELNCDLTEAIALGHDIGHTPFGHAGERMLHEIMSPPNTPETQAPKSTVIYKLPGYVEQHKYINYYGFKYNLQSVRAIVEDLDAKDSQFGLDVTNYTLWGIMHHSAISFKERQVNTDFIIPKFYDGYMKYCQTIEGRDAWSFEGLIVAEANEIAQMHHDLEDAIRGRALPKVRVLELIEMLNDIMPGSNQLILNELRSKPISQEWLLNPISKIIVDTLVSNLVKASKENLRQLLNEYDVAQIFELQSNNEFIQHAISYDTYGTNKASDIVSKFKHRLSETALNNYHVQRSDSKGKYIIKNLFEAYNTNPQQLPNYAIKNLYKELKKQNYGFSKEISSFSDDDTSELRLAVVEAINDIKKENKVRYLICVMRIICDHIARMTDNYAISEYEKLYG